MRQIFLVVLVILFVSIGEYRLIERTFFASQPHLDFVLLNIDGILTGYPSGRVFQNRLLGPWLVTLLADFLFDGVLDKGLRLFTAVSLFVTNGVIFGLVYGRLQKVWWSLTAVGIFSLLRTLFIYDLEYPWDHIDIILFALFGYWVRERMPKWWFPCILLIGVLNRESVLFFALWFVLEEIWTLWQGQKGLKRLNLWKLCQRFFLLALLGSIIFLVRNWLFIGPTPVDGMSLDNDTIGNLWNLAHNLNQLLRFNWRSSLIFVNLSLIGAILIMGLFFKREPVAIMWTLAQLVAILAFGFINETRLYLPLFAFWVVYGWGDWVGMLLRNASLEDRGIISYK